MPTVHIDANEPHNIRASVAEEIEARTNDLNHTITGLETGDFVMNDVCIERKEASDFAGSVTDGRLKEQSARMATDFTHNYVILEGWPYNLEHSNLHPNSVAGMCASLAVKKDVGIVVSRDTQTTAYLVHKIMQTHAEDNDFDPEQVTLKKTKADTEDTFVAMLTCINGISQEKGEQIADRFRSMAHLAGYTETDEAKVKEDLTRINGIGDILAQRVIDEVS